MILEQTNDVQISMDEGEGHDFSIDMDSMSLLFKGFSDNLYSNKIGSIVREITSNCFDAHEELGIRADVEITIKDPDPLVNESGKVSFRDFGVGLDPERIKNIFSKYFSSTKRGTNGQIGGFGIGAKSPLSYTEFFEVHTIVGGIKYQYMVHRGVKVPRIELIHKEESDEPRGTEIIIPLKSPQDAHIFRKEMRSQLMYFDNIYYTNCGIDNDYTIIRGKHFIIRERSGMDTKHPTSQMRACIGKVSYPLDFSQLDIIDSYNIRTDIALLFDIGEISVTMNRENIEYNDRTINVIKQRIKDVSKELAEIRMKSVENEEDLSSYISLALNKQYVKLGNSTYKVPEILIPDTDDQDKLWNFEKFKDLRFIGPSHHYFDELFSIRAYVGYGSISRKGQPTKVSVEKLISLHGKDKQSDIKLYRIKGPISEKKIAYISEKVASRFYLISMRSDPFDLDTKQSFVYKSNKYQEYVNKMRKKDPSYKPNFQELVLSEYKKYINYVGKYLIEHTESYDALEIPEDWLEEYNKTRYKAKRDKSIITLRRLSNGGIYTSEKDSVFKLEKMRVKELYAKFNDHQLIVYGFQGEEDGLKHVSRRLNDSLFFSRYNNGTTLIRKYNWNHRLAIFKISKENVKYLKDFKNCHHWSKLTEDELSMLETKYEKYRLLYNGYNLLTNTDTLVLLGDFISPGARVVLTDIMRYEGCCPETLNKVPWFKIAVSEDGKEGVWDTRHSIFVRDLIEKFIKYCEENRELLDLLEALEGIEMSDYISTSIKNALKKKFKPFYL